MNGMLVEYLKSLLETCKLIAVVMVHFETFNCTPAALSAKRESASCGWLLKK